MSVENVNKGGWQQNVWIKDGSTGLSMTEREREIVIPKEAFEKVAGKIISQELQSKIYTLEKQVKELKNNNQQINVSEGAAEEILRDAIVQFKEKGISEIDIIDLHSKTKLPINQIREVMDKLEGEGVVSEDGET